AVLHLEPGEVIVRRFHAVAVDVERRDRVAEDLLTIEQLLLRLVIERLGGVLHERPYRPAPGPARVDRSDRHFLRLRNLRARQDEAQRQNRGGCGYYGS